MLFCSVNGQKVNSISVADRGFCYGDGVFTTAKIINGQVECLSAHIRRLKQARTKLLLPAIDFTSLTQDIINLAQSYPLAVLKITITAGQGGRGYTRKDDATANVIISIFTFPDYYPRWQKQGIKLGLSEQRMGINPMLHAIKHLNRLEQVLLRNELEQSDEDELLVLNINDHITETTSANVFWFINDQLYTPDITASGVSGLMREFILEMLPNTLVGNFSLTDINQADEIFICNALMHIVPVRTFNKQLLSMEKVHFLQKKLQKKLQEKR